MGLLSRERPEPPQVRKWLILALVCVVGSLAGCPGLGLLGPAPRGPSQALIDRNNRNLLRLQGGMFQEHVFNIMGEAQRIEWYPWGAAWLYRTAKPDGASKAAGTEFTPLVFDRSGVLLGWGREILLEQVKRDEQRK